MKRFICVLVLCVLPLSAGACRGAKPKSAKNVIIKIYKGTCTALKYICQYKDIVCAKSGATP